jgi:hypothetical protein
VTTSVGRRRPSSTETAPKGTAGICGWPPPRPLVFRSSRNISAAASSAVNDLARRLPPPRGRPARMSSRFVFRRVRGPAPRTGNGRSGRPCAGLARYAVLRRLQAILARLIGAWRTCQTPLPAMPSTRGKRHDKHLLAGLPTDFVPVVRCGEKPRSVPVSPGKSWVVDVATFDMAVESSSRFCRRLFGLSETFRNRGVSSWYVRRPSQWLPWWR